MKYLILLLLITNAAGYAGAQPDAPGAGVEPPARPQLPEQPATALTPGPTAVPAPAAHAALPRQATTAPEDGPCPHCSRAEQLVVDLIYYKQILDLLGEIDRQREQINKGLLRSAHAELARIRPDLAALLKPEKVPATPVAPVPEKPKKPAKKPVKTVYKPKPAPRPSGIEGLVVGHVNGENRELGIKTSVVLVSNGRPRSLGLDGVIEHNRRKFRIVKVDYVEDRHAGNRHEVHLQDQTSKQLYVVPWQ